MVCGLSSTGARDGHNRQGDATQQAPPTCSSGGCAFTLRRCCPDQPKLEAVWPIISNKEAIAVNQAWAGHPGRLAMQDPEGKSWRVWAKAMPAGGQVGSHE